MVTSSSFPVQIIKVCGNDTLSKSDLLAMEEPLEIRLLHGPQPQQTKNLSVTMRTPGNDNELAIGFLFTEGIIKAIDEVISVDHLARCSGNKIQITLAEGVNLSQQNLDRNFYTTSSCGVCGKTSIEAVKTVRSIPADNMLLPQFLSETILALPSILRSHQQVFDQTGGLHGCGLFTIDAQLILAREDVGRHNALDKLIGASLLQSLFPLYQYLLLLSGRVSFELVQKAWMAGITTIAAIGAPSSLAVQTAEAFGITLVGFLRNNTFNIYTGTKNILINTYENTHQG